MGTTTPSADQSEKTWLALEREIVACRRCPRLVAWREVVAQKRRRAYADWQYWGRPVPGFGDHRASLLVLGLAPGAHGSNRTGRMFTGDASGDFLYPALHRAGFASQPTSSHLGDGLELRRLFITALCRCAPPKNKPAPREIENCRPYLLREIALLDDIQGIVALGRVAFDQVLKIYGVRPNPGPRFTHNGFCSLGDGKPWLLASYHPSRQNTQTGRLTTSMFDQVWQRARELLSDSDN
jgi:uracil-DNA glycosylase family 4